MIDSLGGPKRVNNMLSTLNLKTISDTNLKEMERRAGDVIEQVSVESSKAAADEAFRNEMENISYEESQAAQANMTGLIDDLCVCPLPDASPSLKLKMQDQRYVHDNDDEWSDDDEECNNNILVEQDGLSLDTSNATGSGCNISFSTPTGVRRPLPSASYTPKTNKSSPNLAKKSRKKLLPKYRCQSRSGMSVAVDTAWQKKGFDSLTSHTFFMTTQKSSRLKVVKTIVGHRTCGVCNWWRRRRPGPKVRPHRCIRNNIGSARSMEATSGVKGVQDLINEGTPIDYLEGDGDNTLIYQD